MYVFVCESKMVVKFPLVVELSCSHEIFGSVPFVLKWCGRVRMVDCGALVSSLWLHGTRFVKSHPKLKEEMGVMKHVRYNLCVM